MFVVCCIRQFPFVLKANKYCITKDLKAVGTTVTKKTACTTLHDNALKRCTACKVLLLRKVHIQPYLKFAREHLNNSEKAWDEVLWSNEAKIKLVGINLIYPKNTIPTVKQAIVMNDCLSLCASPTVDWRPMGRGWVFQHDNDPKYIDKASHVKWYNYSPYGTGANICLFF
uniref:Transposase Tc1-like domain-containing protein n=1 Tax=Pundamilia nyererei TaxID=303518 RepID=A0A3B4GRS3_9CICH